MSSCGADRRLGQALGGLFAQVSQGAAGIGLILVFRDHGRSLSAAGVVVAAIWIAGGIARPVQGRLIDRQGAASVMAFSGLVHGAALAGMVGLVSGGAGTVWLVLTAVIAGIALPPVSTSMRLVWAELAGAEQRTAAYSLVYLVQELAVLTGPLMLSGLVALSSASVAVIAIAAVSTIGSLGFAATVAGGRVGRATDAGEQRPAVLRIGAMRTLLMVASLIGGAIGAIQVAAPALATSHHAPAATGLLIAGLSVGGIGGAALYATSRWQTDPPVRLAVLTVTFAAWCGVAGSLSGLLVTGAVLLLAGLALNPALSTLSLVVDQHVAQRAAGEAFGWLSTGIAGGSAAGTVLAATLAQHQHEARPAFIVAAVAAACAAWISWSLRTTVQ